MKPVFRCSSVHALLTKPKDKNSLISKTAEAELKKILKEELFDYKSQLDNKYLQKGIMCEQEAIELYNSVMGRNYVKNTVRYTVEFDNFVLTGEPDICSPSTTVDIKNAWSLDTFPLFGDDANKDIYESQVRAYIMLRNHSDNTDINYEGEIAYCLVDTPDELIKYENPKAHTVSQFPPELRVSTSRFERSKEWEYSLVEALNRAGKAYVELRNQFYDERGIAR